MKKYAILLFIWLTPFFLFAQIQSRGTKFWVSYMYGNESDAYYLIFSAKNPCAVRVENPKTGWVKNIRLEENGTERIQIPGMQCYTGFYNRTMQKGLLITSSDVISAYAQNYLPVSSDIACLLPESALGDEYIIQAYPSRKEEAQFMVIAAENNTIIDIYPSCPVSGGFSDKKPIVIRLNKGETYQVHTLGDDISGTHIKSRNEKKIAVFSGSSIGHVPAHYRSGDHMFEQALPLYAWGKEFAVVNLVDRPASRIRVTASADDTRILKNDILLTTINAYETYEFEISESETSCYLQTSQPCIVYQYMISWSYAPAETEKSTVLGDPSMSLIPPLDYKTNQNILGTYSLGTTVEHRLNVVLNTKDAPTFRLDSMNVSSPFFPLNGNPEYSYARLTIEEGTHLLQSNEGYIAHTYGYGDYESYLYYPEISFSGQDTTLLDVQITYIPEICGDQQFFPVFYENQEGVALSYSVEFKQHFLDIGFKNMMNTTVNADNSINVLLPENIMPGTYQAVVKFFNKYQKSISLPIEFTVNYSNKIITQRWNNILTLKSEVYNDGRDFKNYQWYKNNQIMEGENQPYLYAYDGLEKNAQYSLQLTRKSDDEVLFTCPVIPLTQADNFDLLAFPSVINRNDLMAIETAGTGMAEVWTLLGERITELKLKAGQTPIVMDYPEGTYIIRIADGSQKPIYGTFTIKEDEEENKPAP